MFIKSLAVMLLLAAFFAEGVAWARSGDMKKPCVNCHTMHNSQGGNTVPGNPGTRGALLNNSCYGCHSDGMAHVDTPVVLHFTQPTYDLSGTNPLRNTLAGGDFYWVTGAVDGLKGHNVDGFSSQAPNRIPPGGSSAFNILTCAGTTGCHGKRLRDGDTAAMYQTHHEVEPLPDPRLRDGNALATSYRWLDGVAGYEDSDYELSVSSSDHNQYFGVARSGDVDDPASHSISHFCAQCHGNFHSGAGALGVSSGTTLGTDPWIRHPVDYAMPLTGEYATYGKPAVNDYNIATPLGRAAVSVVNNSTVTAMGDRIITCISCHRAHGSPYDYSLRWDYKSWPTAGYNGCGDCHTAKN
jgi:hypothetical protein